MKILVAGVQRVKGTSKTGNPFDMCILITLQSVENVANPKVQINGFGFKTMDLPCDPEIIPQFAAFKFPCVVEVQTEPRPNMGKFETTVIGVSPVVVQPLAKAA